MGPLAGLRIVEMAGIGPAPFAATLLADMGAELIRVDRREATDLGLPGREAEIQRAASRPPLACRRRQDRAGCEVVKRLAAKADASARRVQARCDGTAGAWAGRTARAQSQARVRPHDGLRPAGTDGAERRPRHQLHLACRRAARHRRARTRRPCRRSIWSATLAVAACFWPSAWCAHLLEAQKSGQGQVVDAAMVDGAAYLMAADVRTVCAGVVAR